MTHPTGNQPPAGQGQAGQGQAHPGWPGQGPASQQVGGPQQARVVPREPLSPSTVLWLVGVTAVAILIQLGVMIVELLYLVEAPFLDSMTVTTILALAAVVTALVAIAAWIAALVLSIIVARRGRGRLRAGAIVLLVGLVAGFFLSVEITGDTSLLPDSLVTATRVLGLVLDLVELGLRVAGVILLLLGLRQLTSGTPAR